MADQAELAFVKNFINTLASQPIVFNDDFQQPPENTLKRVPVLQVEVPSPPERKVDLAESVGILQVTFKSLKPPFSISVSVSPADPISSIKTQIAAEPRAPPADAQRLLFKGKALADAKLLKEYTIKDGDIVNLMVKPGFEWDPSKESLKEPASEGTSDARLSPNPSGKKRGHGRIPSVVLSPTPSSPSDKPQDIPLVLDTGITLSADMPSESSPLPQSTYRSIISKPEFWEKLHFFLSGEFHTRSDASTAFEDFLNASKGVLTVSEIAKIRDHVGVVGMAGT